jgi:hypothetical protein
MDTFIINAFLLVCLISIFTSFYNGWIWWLLAILDGMMLYNFFSDGGVKIEPGIFVGIFIVSILNILSIRKSIKKWRGK